MPSRPSAVPASVFPARYECANCGSSHLTPDGTFPEGWRVLRGNCYCPDCVSRGADTPRAKRGGRS